MQNIQSWHCVFTNDGGTSPIVTSSDCTTTASTTYSASVVVENLSTSTASSTVPYGDWLLVNSLIIFLLAFIPVSAVWSLFKDLR
jgi:hypothetical protein